MSLTSDGSGMKTTLVSRSIAVVLLVLTVSAWAAIILVALHVSAIVLDTLQMIVELAALTP